MLEVLKPPTKGNVAPPPSLPLHWPLYVKVQGLLSSDKWNFQSYFIIPNKIYFQKIQFLAHVFSCSLLFFNKSMELFLWFTLLLDKDFGTFS